MITITAQNGSWMLEVNDRLHEINGTMAREVRLTNRYGDWQATLVALIPPNVTFEPQLADGVPPYFLIQTAVMVLASRLSETSEHKLYSLSIVDVSGSTPFDVALFESSDDLSYTTVGIWTMTLFGEEPEAMFYRFCTPSGLFKHLNAAR